MRVSANTKKQPFRFTFLTETKGSTIIEQFEGFDVQEAVSFWFRESEILPGEPSEGNVLSPITGIKNAWCTSGHDPHGSFFLVHIIATADSDVPFSER
jgi:hypothetical protein